MNDLVTEIQHLAPDDPRRPVLIRELYTAALPTLRRVAGRFTNLGSLEPADLLQVGTVELLKLLNRWRPAMGPFGAVLFVSARRACLDQLRLHSTSLRPSDAAQKRGGARRPMAVELTEANAGVAESPEDAVGRAQLQALVRRAVGALPRQARDTVRMAHGVGGARVTLRARAVREGRTFASVRREVQVAEELLRRDLKGVA